MNDFTKKQVIQAGDREITFDNELGYLHLKVNGDYRSLKSFKVGDPLVYEIYSLDSKNKGNFGTITSIFEFMGEFFVKYIPTGKVNQKTISMAKAAKLQFIPLT